MNFLAHLHLAEPGAASRVGNLLGDFVRGTPASLAPRFPAVVIRGIRQHRAIDRFTDSHPIFIAAKKLLAPERRRLAGISIDVFFDHFLTNHWQTFSRKNLGNFIAESYQMLENNPQWLTPELREILPRMKEENWLLTNGTIAGIELTLNRISHRRPFLSSLREAHLDLIGHYQSFDRAFHDFYPQILNFSKNWDDPV